MHQMNQDRFKSRFARVATLRIALALLAVVGLTACRQKTTYYRSKYKASRGAWQVCIQTPEGEKTSILIQSNFGRTSTLSVVRRTTENDIVIEVEYKIVPTKKAVGSSLSSLEILKVRYDGKTIRESGMIDNLFFGADEDFPMPPPGSTNEGESRADKERAARKARNKGPEPGDLLMDQAARDWETGNYRASLANARRAAELFQREYGPMNPKVREAKMRVTKAEQFLSRQSEEAQASEESGESEAAPR